MAADFHKDWVTLKKVVTNTMKMYGDGLIRLEVITQDILNDWYNDLEKRGGRAYDPHTYIMKITANVMAALVSHASKK